MEDSIIKLQTTLAHQEEEILSLSGELYAQQKEMAELKRQFAELNGRLKALSEGDGGGSGLDVSDEPPPPHY